MPVKSAETGRDIVVRTADYVHAWITLDHSDTALARVNTFTHMDLKGFTGGVMFACSDPSGKRVYQSPVIQHGVDGKGYLSPTAIGGPTTLSRLRTERARVRTESTSWRFTQGRTGSRTTSR